MGKFCNWAWGHIGLSGQRLGFWATGILGEVKRGDRGILQLGSRVHRV